MLVRRYQNLVLAIAYARTANLEVAQEIAQDAFLASFERLTFLKSPAKYKQWLSRITRRLCSNWRRSEKYQKALLERLRRVTEREDRRTPAGILIERESRAMVDRAVEKVPTRTREALILYYYQGRSVSETASVLGVPEESVRKRLERGRKAVRNYLVAEVETTLERSRPSEGFANRVLAAIPATSSTATRTGDDPDRQEHGLEPKCSPEQAEPVKER